MGEVTVTPGGAEVVVVVTTGPDDDDVTATVGPSGFVRSVVPGSNVTVDDTDPAHPVVSAVSSGADAMLTAGVTVSGHRAVTISGGQVIYADRTIPSHAKASIGLTTGAATVGTTVAVRFGGILDEPSWTWTPDAAVYLSTTGLLTQTPPTAGFLRQIAWAVSATRLFIDPRESLALT